MLCSSERNVSEGERSGRADVESRSCFVTENGACIVKLFALSFEWTCSGGQKSG